MKLNSSYLILLAILMAATVVSAQEVSVDQLKQMMAMSAENLTTYTYSRSAEGKLFYSNASLQENFSAVKVTEGKVDLTNTAGWWNSTLTDKNTGGVLTWEGYFQNGSEYWREDSNWTSFEVNDTSRIMQDYNEIPGQIDLINYSTLSIAGQESLAGVDCYRLTGSPTESIYNGMIGLQLLAAYLPSPFPLPEVLKNRTLDIDRTDLLNNSRIDLTAWVSRDGSLLRRLDINSSLTVTPKILNISSADFEITSIINESTVYEGFGAPVQIELPKEYQNESFRFKGTDWRWAVFGSVRP